VKDKIYANALQTIQELKHIKNVICEIEPQLCENVMRDFLKRVDIYKIAIYRILCPTLNFRVYLLDWNKNIIFIFSKKALFF